MSPRLPTTTVARTAVATAVCLTAACAAAGVVLHTTLWSIGLPLIAVVFLAVPVVGSAMAQAQPKNPVGWILLLSGVSLSLAATAYLVAEAAYVGGRDVRLAPWAGWLDGWPWVFALGVVPTVGLLIFPDGRLPSRRWRPVLWASVAQIAALLLGLLFAPSLLDFPTGANPAALPGGLGQVFQGLVGVIALTAPLSTLAAWSLHRRRKNALGRDAAALALVEPAAWLICASWWGCIAIGVAGGPTMSALPVESLGMLALAGAAWAAIRRFGLFDGRLILNRALVYGVLTGLVVVVYLAVAVVAGSLTSDVVGGAVATVIALLIAMPMRDRLQRVANRLVYGYRDDPYGALVVLGERLRDAAASDEVLPRAARSVQAALRLRYVTITVDGVVRAQAGIAMESGLESFPLVFAGERIGELRAGRDDSALTAAERRVLREVSAQVAAAGHAVSLTDQLLRSRERLVAATEEERRRLRRDLHDGLGPTLAGIVLGLHRARRRVVTESPVAAEQLDALTAQVQQAVAEVRRLVHGLRPPALDELGLVGALNEQARALGSVVVEGPSHDLFLPAAVEVAAYRIAMEAMTNVARHSGALRSTLNVSIDQTASGRGVLRLQVSDDGAGLPEAYRAGVGIASMRERAAELGGNVVIEAAQPRGTRVTATLPLVAT